MKRKHRIAAWGSLVVAATLLTAASGLYLAARQVRPFYQQALAVEPTALEEGSRELESRATTLYSDVRQVGRWSGLFTAEQINGWLASENRAGELPEGIRDPRVAIAPDQLTLGFRTSAGGIETVASVDATVFLTDDGAVAIRLISVRAGALPLPVMQVADELAEACRKLRLPVRWSQESGHPVAIVELHSAASTNRRRLYLDVIQLGDGQLYVAGHTDAREDDRNAELNDYELRLTPDDAQSSLELARRPRNTSAGKPLSPER